MLGRFLYIYYVAARQGFLALFNHMCVLEIQARDVHNVEKNANETGKGEREIPRVWQLNRQESRFGQIWQRVKKDLHFTVNTERIKNIKECVSGP